MQLEAALRITTGDARQCVGPDLAVPSRSLWRRLVSGPRITIEGWSAREARPYGDFGLPILLRQGYGGQAKRRPYICCIAPAKAYLQTVIGRAVMARATCPPKPLAKAGSCPWKHAVYPGQGPTFAGTMQSDMAACNSEQIVSITRATDRAMRAVRLGILLLAGVLAAAGRAQDAPSARTPASAHPPRRAVANRVPASNVPGGPRAPVPQNLAFFPPTPPPLDSTPPPANTGNPEFSAPDELAAFVNEPFYPPLATRLVASNPDGQLNDEQKRQLDAYRANKAALQTELLAHLYTLRETDPATRLRSMEAFAREQTPQLVALERTAESFRHDLIRADLAGSPVRAGGPAGLDRSSKEKPPGMAAALRLAIFYNDGLSSAQRRLVREILIDQEGTEPGGAPSAKAGSWIFFSPDAARVRLPLSLPTALASQVTDYVRTKDALKQELRDTLLAPAPPSLPGQRQVLETLAVAQAPRIATLEALAEDIRRSLRGWTVDPLRVPHLASLPAELEERIAAYRRNKLELQKALLARVQEITGREAAGSPALQEKIQQTIATFTQENAARYAALSTAKEAIRSDLARIAASARPGDPGNDQSADRLLKDFTDSFQQYEQWRLYYEYRIAVFEPGLSPEQRRLLFDGAIEKLALPLPGGALLPVGAFP